VNSMNEITIDELNTLKDALHYAGKTYPGKTDEERLALIEMYLKAALGECGEIRKRWAAGKAKRDEDRVG
jgi:hypothetical protein